MKSLDKKKANKLDWEKELLSDFDLFWNTKPDKETTKKYFVAKLKDLLTYQRQQILKDILKVMKDSPYMYNGKFEEYIKGLIKI